MTRPLLRVFVEGPAKGQPRPRATTFLCKKRKKRRARLYDDGSADEWRALVSFEVAHRVPVRPYRGALALRLNFHFKRPARHFRRQVLRDDAPREHAQKPDVDNLAKAIMDELTECEFWCDDAQIAYLVVQRSWARGRDGCEIILARYVEEEAPADCPQAGSTGAGDKVP